MVGIAIHNASVDIHPTKFPFNGLNVDEDLQLPMLKFEVVHRITSILELLCIPKEIRSECIIAFRLYLQRLVEISTDKAGERPRFETAVTACALIVARSHHVPISVSDAAAWANINMGLLHTSYYQIVNLVCDRIQVGCSNPKIYFDRVFKAARLSDQKVCQVAEQILSICLGELIVVGRSSSAIAAAVISVAFRSVHSNPLPPDQISQIESELHLPSIHTDVSYVLASLARLASLLPFNMPFGPESLDLYLPEIIFHLDQLMNIVNSDPFCTRAYGPFITPDVITRIEVAQAVIRACRHMPSSSVYIGELPIDILSNDIILGPVTKSHLESNVRFLIQRSVPLISILNCEYNLD